MQTRRVYLGLLGTGLAGALAGCAGVPLVGSAGLSQRTKLAAADGDSEDKFGESVALSGDGTTALVGAYGDEDPNGEDGGAAYLFTRADDGWTQQTKLVPGDGASGDRFGVAVALADDGATALVGARGEAEPNGYNAGSAYVFSRDGDDWRQRAELVADDGDRYDSFGASVALSGDGATALVGADGDEDPNGDDAGAAYVFSRASEGWNQQAKLVPDDGDSGDGFGVSVALAGDGATAILGANEDEDPNGAKAGSAYVFALTGGAWSQQTKLVPDDGESGDRFGTAVTLADDATALVGAPEQEDPNGEGSGSAYVFERTDRAWSQQAKLVPDDGGTYDVFGSAVALTEDGTGALVGAHGDQEPNGSGGGSAYVLAQADDGWSQQTKLAAADGDGQDVFGESVAVSSDGTTALAGAGGDEDPKGPDAGSVYVFEK